jgi:P pilus assembly chaperone PapD
MFVKPRFGPLFTCLTLGTVSLIFCLQSWAAVSISNRRIYVDYEQGMTNFTVTSREKFDQECNVSLTYNSFDERGNLSHYTGSDLPPYAADNIIRFSPKQFLLPANQKQTIRFSLRRSPNTPDMEHRSYVVLGCSEVKSETTEVDLNNESPTFIIKPQLKHSIPLIVRPQKLQAEVSFDKVAVADELLSFDLHRKGNRSIYGYITVMNKDSGEVISTSAPVIMYTETTTKSFHMNLPKALQQENLLLRFKEDANQGGDIEITWPQGVN